VASTENSGLASMLIEETCAKHGVTRDSLTLHSDRGSPMRAKTTAEFPVDLGVAASFSRPRVSNDNPFSEAHFKTLKYRPQFPACFEGLDHARAHSREFFLPYNNEHHHSGIGFMTPAAMHFGTAPALWQQRAAVLQAAYLAHPERFTGKHPTPPKLPTVVGIDLPKPRPPEPSHDLIQTPASLTNLHTQVSHSH
jgi:putative transposase